MGGGLFAVPQRQLRQRAEDGMFVGRDGMVEGRVHYVYPTTAYASWDSHSWLKNHNPHVYNSVADALADCVAGRGDHIVLGPGTHTVSTTSLAMSKAGVKIWGYEAWYGVPVMKSKSILTTDIAGDQIMNVSAADCGVIGVTIIPITAADAIDLTADADGFLVDACHFDLYTPAANTATVGVTGAAASFVEIRNSVFISDGAQGNAIVATALLDSMIVNCKFICTGGTWASVILCGAATDRLLIDGCTFTCAGTAITAGVNGTGATLATGVHVQNCRASSLVTKLVDNFDASECELSENYDCGVGGGDGGALVTVIT